MKQAVTILILTGLLCLTPLVSMEDESDLPDLKVTYLDGWVDKKANDGALSELFFGDPVYLDETVITDLESSVELENAQGARITINEDSVFLYTKRVFDGQLTNVASCLSGQIKYRFDRLFGPEPLISTPSMVAGIRGTEFIVYTAPDGSTVMEVFSGLVSLHLDEDQIDIAENEGLEIDAASSSVRKYSLMDEQIDFSTWSDQALERLMDDPISALKRLEGLYDQYRSQIDLIREENTAINAVIADLAEEYRLLKESGDQDGADQLYNEVIHPQQVLSNNLALNIRFYTLSAYSLKRFLAAPLFVRMKILNFSSAENEVYQRFLESYQRINQKFEDSFSEFLSPYDI